MKVGIPSEVKNHEYRVALTPAGVHQLVGSGHTVLIQAGAGEGSAITDEQFAAAGATILADAAEVWGSADLVCKVKEPVPSEYGLLRDDLVLFTYLHLAADRPATDALLAAGTTSIAYETVQLPDGSLPLLAPMSEVAGRLSTQVGAYHLMKNEGGGGVLLGGVPGVDAAKVVVLGGGVVGRHAAEIAVGMRADVAVLDLSMPRLRDTSAPSRPAPTRSSASSSTPTSSSAPCWSPGPARRTWSPTSSSRACDPAPSSSTSRSTRAAASRTRTPPPTTTRPSSCTGPSSTASPTCPEPSPSRPPEH